MFREIIAAGVFAKVDIRLTEFSRFGRQRNNRSADYGKIAVVIRIVRDDHDYEVGINLRYNLLHMVVTNFKVPLGLIKIYMALSYPVDLAKSKDFQAFLSRKIQVSSARGAVNERVEIERG